MPLLNRDTLVDRPVLLDRSGDNEQEDEEAEASGDAGLEINGIEFETGDYELVSASNLIAAVATGQDSGEDYETTFRNAAIQLKKLNEEQGRDIKPLSDFAAQTNVDLLNVSPIQSQQLQQDPTGGVGDNLNGTTRASTTVSTEDRRQEDSIQEEDTDSETEEAEGEVEAPEEDIEDIEEELESDSSSEDTDGSDE